MSRRKFSPIVPGFGDRPFERLLREPEDSFRLTRIQARCGTKAYVLRGITHTSVTPCTYQPAARGGTVLLALWHDAPPPGSRKCGSPCRLHAPSILLASLDFCGPSSSAGNFSSIQLDGKKAHRYHTPEIRCDQTRLRWTFWPFHTLYPGTSRS